MSVGEDPRAERERLLTELRGANARLRRAEELRTDLKSVAGHELRIPLNNLVGGLDTLVVQWDALHDDQRRSLAELSQRAARRLERVADALARMAQSDATTLGAEPSVVSLRPLLVDVLAALGIEGVELRCPERVVAYATPSHVEQMVTNLVTNAARYGVPPIIVDVEVSGDRVTIAVDDGGVGVAATDQERIWDPYVRAVPDGSSPGLGLAIVRALAEANGGQASYESDDHHRSRFLVTLPAGGVAV